MQAFLAALVVIGLFSGLVSRGPVSAAAGQHSSEVARLLVAAKQGGERELGLSWGQALGSYEGARKFEGLFNRIYGTAIKVNFTPGPSMTDMAGKVSLEVRAGKKPSTDILLGTESHYAELLNRNILEDYAYTSLSPRIRKQFVSPNNIGVEAYAILVGITYNTNLVSNSEVPRRLEDVFHPKWKGKVASTQNAGSFDRVAFRPEWSYEKMKGFVTRLAEHVGGLVRCNDDLRVASGEFVMMVLNCNSAFARGLKAKGAPIGHVVPEDAATVGFGYLGIPRTSPNSNLGKLFINMLLTEEGQSLIYELTSQDHIGFPGSQQAAELTELKRKGIEPLRVDVKFVSEHPEIRGLSAELRTILRSKQNN